MWLFSHTSVLAHVFALGSKVCMRSVPFSMLNLYIYLCLESNDAHLVTTIAVYVNYVI